ncbi:amino acid adenylation domain-containing protein [Kitasatospora sp. NPDC059146]|uniref:amino acid adenylation domain-containing protein n=1 Tax=Kitasatospora sp. NPDC059146 TaxID=3346741 RepID=UPI003698FB4F
MTGAPTRTRRQPVSRFQRQLWLAERIAPAPGTYNLPVLLELRGTPQLPALAEALRTLLRRHAVLRWQFPEADGEPHAEDSGDPEVPVAGLDWRELSAPDREARLAAFFREPFALDRGPLVRAALARTGPDRHWFALCVHHLLVDGWSIGILLRELAAAYSAAVHGREPELPPPGTPFAQDVEREPADLTRQSEFWKKSLAGAPQRLTLPFERGRDSWSGQARRYDFGLSPELSARLRGLGEERRASPAMTLMTAYLALLARFGATTDVLGTVPVVNRLRPGLGDTVGLLTNTLPVRLTLAPGASFADALTQVRDRLLNAMANADVPYQQIVDAVATEREPHVPTLCQTLFTWGESGPPLVLDGLETELRPAPEIAVRFDQMLFAGEQDGRIELRLEYPAELYDEDSVAEFAESYVACLTAMAEDCDQPVESASLVSERQRRRMAAWSRPRPEPPRSRTVHQAVEHWAATGPRVVALHRGERTWDYGWLNATANRLARRLRAAGIGPGDVVALRMERSVERVVAWLATAKAGACYLSVDPGDSTDSTDSETGRAVAGAALLLAHEALAADPLPGVPLLLWERTEPELAALDGTDLGLDVDPDDPACLVFTSGTTGPPKAVRLAHRGLVNLAAHHREAFGVGPGEVVLQLAAAGCDASVGEWAGALANGAALRLPPTRDVHDRPAEVVAALREPGATVVALPPSLAAALPDDALPAVRVLLLRGEPSPPELLTRWAARVPVVADTYGVGEATVTSTSFVHRPGFPARTVGTALPGVGIHVLDEAGRPLPPGLVGEIGVSGEGLAPGGGLTPGHPDSPNGPDGAPARIHRTGDLGRFLPDGNLVFEGRRGDRTELRGHRVDPDRIASALRTHRTVRDAAVTAAPVGTDGPRLTAYVVPAGQAPAGEEARARLRLELRDHLAERLGPHPVPEAYVLLDELPLNPRSLTLRPRALPRPGADSLLGPDASALRTATQRELAGIWSGLLGVETVGPDDSFFLLRGNSLLVVKVGHAIRARFGVDLPVRRLFERSTLRDLAETVDEALAARDAVDPAARRAPAEPLPRATDRPEWPLSFAQARMWFLDRLTDGNPAYHVPLALRLTGRVSAEEVGRLLTALVRRHEVLRTAYVETDRRPVQRVLAAAPVRVAVSDLRGLDRPEGEREWRRLAAADLARPFALTAGENLRARLVALDEEHAVLLLCLHHIAVDGWSVEQLLAELAALSRGEDLPPVPLRYVDYASWQREIGSDRLDQQLAHWKSRLDGAPERLELPTDHPRPPEQDYRGATVTRPLAEGLSAGLRKLAADCGVTEFVLYLTAFQVWLGRMAGSEDVVVGTAVAGRHYVGSDRLVGLMANSLALRLRHEGTERFTDLVARARDTVVTAQENQDLPFELLVDHLDVARDLGRTPVFQTMFTLADRLPAPFDLAGATAELLTLDADTAKFDLSLHVQTGGVDGPYLRADHATAILAPDTVAQWLEGFETFLRSVLARPDGPVRDLDLLPPARRAALRRLGSGPVRAYGPEPVTDLVAGWVRRDPGRTAVEDATGRLGYRELSDLADRVAAGLHRHGVRPGDPVVVALPRDRRLPAALLGILRAGASFVPVDPAHPAARTAHVVEDCGARLALGDPGAAGLSCVGWADLTRPGGADLIEAGGAPGPTGPTGPGPDAVAYTIYTSGSTGRPKGVVVSHRSLANSLRAMAEVLGTGPGHRLLAITTTAFDISVLELLLPLTAGGTVIVADEQAQRDPDTLRTWLADHRADVLQATPATWQGLLDTGWAAPRDFTAVVGGEALPQPLADRLTERTGTAWNVYGPTEATIWSTAARLVRHERVHLGRPLPNTRASVLDASGRPVPQGVVGMLHLAGAGLAVGYLGRPDLDAAAFGTDPETGERLYRTGDLARMRADGTLEFLGRQDAQVKIRGFRIEPGDVEATLSRLAGVERAVVTAVGSGAHARLVAFLQQAGPGADGPSADGLDADGLAEAARRRAQEQLPEYLRPSQYLVLAELPLTPNRKVDTAALRALAAERTTAARPDDPVMMTPVQYALRRLWHTVLGGAAPGLRDDFFASGGTSVLAVRLAREIQREFGTEVRVADVFHGRTVERLAELVGRAGGTPPQLPVLLDLPDLGNGAATAPADGEPPVFAIHPAGGTAYCYQPLAELLRSARCVGVNHPHLDDLEHRYATLREMAEEYARLLRARQPAGPYRLLGWSFGGTLAYEIGRVLERAGERVAGVVILDAHNWGPRAAALAALDIDEVLEHQRRHGQHVDRFMEKDARESDRLLRASCATAAGFPVLLFKPTDRDEVAPALFDDEHNGWRGLPAALTLRRVEGNHGSLLRKPALDRIAAEVDDFFAVTIGVTT